MTRLRRVARFCLGLGVHGGCHPMVGVEVILAGLLAATLVDSRTPVPEPVPVIYMCRPSHTHCRDLAHDAQAEAVQVQGTTP